MYSEYSAVLTAMNEYLAGFKKGGYDPGRADGIAKLLEDPGETPLSAVFSSLGFFGSFERCTALLGFLAKYSRRAGDTLSEFFGARPGCITPEAACELFLGVSDIFPVSGLFEKSSALARIFDGAEASYGAQMSLKGFIADFISRGELDDEAFPDEPLYDTRYLPLSGSERAVSDILSALSSVSLNFPFVLQLCGDSGVGRRTAAGRAYAAANVPFAMIEIKEPITKERAEELSTKLFLLGARPVLIRLGGITNGELAAAARLFAEETGFVTVINESVMPDELLCADTVTVKLGYPSIEEQYRLWQSESEGMSIDRSVDFSELSGEFSLTPGAVKKALRYAKIFAGEKPLTSADIKTGCYRSINSDMGTKAVKINAVFGWDDIVLPDHSKRLMRTACDQVRYRHKVYDKWGFSEKIAYGKSVSMIFTGPPGTGKTMGAQVMAAELGLDVYRVSLANVVSKYIGETEKNLDEIFDKAKKSKVILFFDEADVLFSKRTEVKDSNDKYSNMESAFLLQKIEDYNGIVILATNLVQNFDEAFKRRMKVIIDFPFPDRKRRAEMWHRAFPKKLPLGQIDFDYLVEFELSGSNIKNIALHSAFLAAAQGCGEVGMKQVMAALKNEYAKSGKAFTKAEAGEYFYFLEN